MSNGIPILMYHAITTENTDGIHRVHVTAAAFAKQMLWLAQNGYHTISVAGAVKILNEGLSCTKYVVLTFDDGFSSVYNMAYPILQQYGYTASLYLVTDVLNKPSFNGISGFDSAPSGDRPLTTTEVKVLQQSGWEIGAHSCTHARHRSLTPSQLHHEIAGSKKVLESLFDIPVRSYAFPFGSYTVPALQQLQDEAYDAGLSVHSGKAGYKSDLRRLPRIEINDRDTPKTFAAKVTTGYASLPQRLKSGLRNILFTSPTIKDMISRG